MPEKLAGTLQYSTNQEIGYLDMINDLPVALGANRVLLYPEATKYISWAHWDQSLRICAADSGKGMMVKSTQIHTHSHMCLHI